MSYPPCPHTSSHPTTMAGMTTILPVVVMNATAGASLLWFAFKRRPFSSRIVVNDGPKAANTSAGQTRKYAPFHPLTTSGAAKQVAPTSTVGSKGVPPTTPSGLSAPHATVVTPTVSGVPAASTVSSGTGNSNIDQLKADKETANKNAARYKKERNELIKKNQKLVDDLIALGKKVTGKVTKKGKGDGKGKGSGKVAEKNKTKP